MAGDKEKPRVKVREWAAAVRWSAKAVGEGGFNDQQPRRVLDEGHVDMEDVVADGEAGERLDGEMDDDEVECLVSGLIYKVRILHLLIQSNVSNVTPNPPTAAKTTKR